MKDNFLRFTIFILFILSSSSFQGQINPRVDYINIDDGLPQNTVQSIIKDGFGFVWIGTDNGLCRYDGYEFEYYFSKGTDDNLWDNRILDLAFDDKVSLFVTTQKGLQIFNLLEGKFVSVLPNEIMSVFKQDVIKVLCVDELLWVVTKTNGIYKLSQANNQLKLSGHYLYEGDNPRPLSIQKGLEGKILLGTNERLYVFDTSVDNFIPYQYQPEVVIPTYVQSILEDQNYLFQGTNNGLFVLNKQTGEIEWYNFIANDDNSLSHANVTALAKSDADILLIGTLGGFCSLNLDNKLVTRSRLFTNREEINQVEFIRSLFADEFGSVWVGTDKIGLAYYNIHQKSFYSLDDLNPEFEVLNKDIINSIFKSGNNLWVGTAGDGLAKVNTKGKDIQFYRTISDKNSIESNFITSIYEDKKDNIWAGSWGMGIQVLQKGSNRILKTYHSENGLPSDFISVMYVNQSGELLVGTQSGLCIYNEVQDRFYPIGPDGGMSVWEVGCMVEDKNGFYWIGTTNGLHRFNGKLVKNDQPTVISRYEQVWYKETNEANSLPNSYVSSLNVDENGDIWVGTYGGGIAKCIETTNGNYEFRIYNQKDGLANNVVYSILTDNSNNIWITTENGLARFNEKDNHFINYYKQDGLRNNQYYWSAAYKDKDGYLYVGGLSGLNYFHPDSIESVSYNTKASITKLNIYNQNVQPGEEYHGQIPLKRSSFANDTITLSYKDNVFSLEFSALNFLHSSKITYAYRLQGVDKDWIKVDSKRRIASYTNLAGGVYPFQLKTTNHEGIWNDDITEVYIEVIPPFWQEMWFKLLVVAFIILLGASYARYRSFRISMQKKRLEQLVRARTLEINEKNKQLEETSQRLLDNNEQLERRRAKIENQKSLLEDQNKEIISQRDQLIALNKEVEGIHQMRMQFFTNISHEFRTPLTLIISPIERILNNPKYQLPENVQKSINIVKRNAERLLMLTNQILTFRKLEAGKLEVFLHDGNLNEVITEIGEAFKVLAEDKNIAYSINVSKGDYEGWYDKSKLENILFNLLSNAFKYTPEDGKVDLELQQFNDEELGKCIKVVVTDTGQGIKKETLEKVFDRFYRADNNLGFGTGIGLSLVKELVLKLNGQISVSSEFGEGSAFTLILPIEEAAFKEYTIVKKEIGDSLSLIEKVNLMKATEEKAELNDDDDREKVKLLIVEDNDDLRNFLSESLSDTYKVYTAVDGQDGYDQALKEEIDLVVSDIMMPRLNGLDLCKQLKNNLNTSHLPIILLSAKGMEENQVEGLGVGADDYITKPFNFALLLAKIKSLVENRQKLKKIYLQNSAEELDLKGGSLDDEFMQKVNNVVSELYADPTFDIEKFSSRMFVSRSLLYKKLKALTNVSPNEYINVFRLKKSIPLLKSKKYQVAEVAVMVGFNDPKYFSRVFKKFYDCSPSEYTGA
ncbi:two-component regulator propeller domain-containing protein [Carboxylicivirga caseinilyticus]|uniref:hybrid sensor histidine kinase/response regulator transcription factor n=1 Tax=Carboxylicivirga caseinilyticus TaxID=3417572 RepID=UPI003D33E466|nr:response regulator [Marinilabiliaceae bacterium A049]